MTRWRARFSKKQPFPRSSFPGGVASAWAARARTARGALRAMADPAGSARGAAGAAPPAAEERLLVAIRPRPLSSGDAPDAALKLSPGVLELVGEGALDFDRVFCASAGNGAVYDEVAAPIVAAVLRGINGAVAAYGQTGSGKTRTMRGTADDPGLVQRAVRGGKAAGGRGGERRAGVATGKRCATVCAAANAHALHAARAAPLATAPSLPPTRHPPTRARARRAPAPRRTPRNPHTHTHTLTQSPFFLLTRSSLLLPRPRSPTCSRTWPRTRSATSASQCRTSRSTTSS
jgi:hypothetical protein